MQDGMELFGLTSSAKFPTDAGAALRFSEQVLAVREMGNSGTRSEINCVKERMKTIPFLMSAIAFCVTVASGSQASVATEAQKSGPWSALLDPPADYVAFPRSVERTAKYACADFDVEEFRQANGPCTFQRVMMVVPRGLKAKAPCVIVPFYFPEAMLGFNPKDGSLEPPFACSTNLTRYAGITYMADLARRGYVTVSADAYHRTYCANATGEWSDWKRAGDALRRDWPQWSGVGKLVFDTRLLVDLAAADARVDAARIGMIGHSLGGKMAFCAGLTDARVKVIVASDFGLGWTQTNWSDVWYWGDRLSEMRARGLSNVDLLSQSGGKPFCLIAGLYDDADSGLLMRSAKGYERCPENLLFLHHGKGHRPPREATEAGYEFLRRHLR